MDTTGMTWAPVTLRWPAQAARNVIAGGRPAMAAQLSQALALIAITPFQSGVGQGRGYQRYLSAPNLLQCLANNLLEYRNTSTGGDQCALAVLFLTTRYDHLADVLSRFNAVLPIPDLQRCERRARHLSRLEAEKWALPTASQQPQWGPLRLERSPFIQFAKQSLTAQLAARESEDAGRSPLGALAALAARKTARATAQSLQLKALQEQFAHATPDTSMVVRLAGPGNAAQLSRALLKGDAPGHEWVLCTGLIMVGPQDGLSFVRELLGL